MSSRVRSGKSLRISASDIPEARYRARQWDKPTSFWKALRLRYLALNELLPRHPTDRDRLLR
jgi:hypothetical protein